MFKLSISECVFVNWGSVWDM